MDQLGYAWQCAYDLVAGAAPGPRPVPGLPEKADRISPLPSPDASPVVAEPVPGAPPLLDLHGVLGPVMAEPFATHCSQFEDLLRAILSERDTVAKGVTDLLFNGNADTPYARLLLLREVGDRLRADVGRLRTPPPTFSKQSKGYEGLQPLVGMSGDADLPPDPQHSYGNAWAKAVHLRRRAGVADLEAQVAIGSPAELPQLALTWLQKISHLLACPDSAGLGLALRKALPNLVILAARFADLEAVKVRLGRGYTGGSRRLHLEVPLDLDSVAKHYDSLAELIRHFEHLSVSLRHPETKAFLMAFSLKEGHITFSLHLAGGKPAWSAECGGEWAGDDAEWVGEPVNQLLAWSAGGTFAVDVEIETVVRLLGLSMARVPFPCMTMHCQVDSGAVHMTCTKVGDTPAPAPGVSWEAILANVENSAWAVLEGVGSLLFDMPRFRQLLLEEFRLDFTHQKCAGRSSGQGWVLRAFLCLAVPTTQVAEVFSQFVKELVSNQIGKMGFLQVLADFFKALSDDAAHLSRPGDDGDKSRQRRPSAPPSVSNFL